MPTRSQSVQRGIELDEHVKDTTQLVGGNADARVPHSIETPFGEGLPVRQVDINQMRTAFIGELAGVI